MKFCTVKRNENGAITKVMKPNGQESKLFTSIAKHPMIKTTEDAYNTYKNVLSKEFKSTKSSAVKGNRLFNQPLKEAKGIADDYMKSIGKDRVRPNKIEKINTNRAKVISNLFDKMESKDNSEETVRAYEAMAEETISQFEFIISKGYEVEINNEEPYSSSSDMISDLRENKNMKIFSTESGFGDEAITDTQRESDPRLRKTQFTDKNGVPLLNNDLFRFVHDFFGHAELGNGFGAIGEENAWNAHVRMYSPLAARAMTTETRGQNSWVNFSGVNDEAFRIRNQARVLRRAGKVEEANALTNKVYEIMSFAEQKIGLLPEWASQAEGNPEFNDEEFNSLDVVDKARILGYEVDTRGSKIVDEKGFKYVKGVEVNVEDVVDTSIMTEGEVELLNTWKGTIKMFGNRGGISSGIATYNASTKVISIHLNNELGEIILSNQENVNNTILHEIVHAKIDETITDREAFDEELSGVVEVLVNNKDKATPYVKSIIKFIELGAPEEVLAYMLTTKELAEFMEGIPATKDLEVTTKLTLWDRLVKLIKQALEGLSLRQEALEILNKYTNLESVGTTSINKELTLIKNLSREDTGGNTFEVSKSVYKSGGIILPVKTINTTQEDLNEDLIDEFIKANKALILRNDLKVGLYKFENTNKVSIDLSIVVPSEKLDIATKIGKGLGQESLYNADSQDLTFTGEDGNNPMEVDDEQIDILSEVIRTGNILPITELLGIEPSFVNKVGDKKFSSYKEALKASEEGESIQIGLDLNGTFTVLMTIRKDTDKGNLEGYINSQVETGFISEEKTKVNTEYRLQPGGETELSQSINMQVIEDDVRAYLGSEGIQRDGLTFTLTQTKDKVIVRNKKGETETVDKSELKDGTYEELDKKYDNATDIITQREWESTRSAYGDRNIAYEEEALTASEEELKVKLLQLLNKLGIKTMSISSYLKKFKERTGVEPSAVGIADIARQIVAYQNGDIETLGEEVAHFINEALPQEDVENVLRNIHKTQEWAEFSEVYRKIYSKDYSGAELEAVVRREVLGKIVAKLLLGQISTEGHTETQRNIFQRVYDILNDLLEKVFQRITPEYSEELNDYLKQVETLMDSNDVSSYVNTENFKDNKFKFYNVSNSSEAIDKLRKKASLVAFQLQDTEKTLMRTNSGSRVDLKELGKIQEKLKTAVEKESITSLVSSVKSNVKGLKAAITDSKKNQRAYFLTDEESVVYQSIKGVVGKAVGEIKVLLKQVREEQRTKEWDPIIKEVDVLILDIEELKAQSDLIDSNNVQRLVDKIMDSHKIPEQDRVLVQKWVEKAEADTNLFHATFGQLVHAKDGLLNLSSYVIKDMHNHAQVRYFSATKKYQDRLKELGITEDQIGKEFVDGGYILSEYDWNEFEAQMDTIFVDTYKEVISNSLQDSRITMEDGRRAILEELMELSNEELIVKKYKGELEELTPKEEVARKNSERPKVIPLIERTMIDSYYDKYENSLKNANVSEVTKQELSNYIADISSLRKKAYRKEGGKVILDYSSLSESDKVKLSNLHKRRKMMKSYVNENGQLKPGLKYRHNKGVPEIDPETRAPIVEVMDPNMLTDESVVALDINNLDKNLGSESEEKSAELFYETLDRIDEEEGREAAIKFLELNAYMTLGQNFWDNLKTGEDTISRLKAKVKESPELETEINNIMYNLTIFTHRMKSIMRIHGRKNNPSEIEVELMSLTSKDSVKELQKSITQDIQEARKILGDYQDSEFESEGFLTGVSEVNESYRRELKDSNLFENENDTPSESLAKANEELDFAKEHMSDENSNLVESNKLSIAQYLTASRANVNKNLEKLIDKLGYTTEDLKDEGVRAEVIRSMVRSRVLPYYKRFTSESYDKFSEGMQEAPVLSDFIRYSEESKNAFVEVNPNPTFFDEQENKDINPNHKKDFKGGYLQPRLDKFKNKKFEEKFGTITETAQGEKTSSKNGNLYKAYLASLEYNEESLDAMNVGETYNNFMLPQARQLKIQRYSTFMKGNLKSNVKNFVKESLSYTEDDMAQGETMFGDTVKVIPKMYVNRLEDPKDISKDLFYSLALRAKEAYSREAKVKYYGDLMSIHDKILTREMKGKDAISSNTYKMVKSAIDYNLFGIKETVTYPIKTPFGVIDLTKIARVLLNFVKFRNLGLNIVIPITSLITGQVTRRIEGYVGEVIDTRSQKLGGREYNRIAVDGMKEIGEINTEAKINVLGQYFKAFDMSESFENSNYGKYLRLLPRTGMMLHGAANYPLYGKSMLGILHDFRIVDGEMVNRNQFKQDKAQEGMSNKEIEKKWRESEDNVIYKYLKHDKNQITWDKEGLKRDLSKEGKALTDEELDSAIDDIYNKTQKHMAVVNSLIDGQIPEEDRVLAQRHYLLSYFMTHRGWLSIAIARRFKDRHLNLETSMTEEGSYRSFWNYMGRLGKEYKDGNFKNFVSSFKEAWDKGDEVDRRNMRRVAIETGIISTLMVLGLGLRAAAEDEDNKDLFALQLTNYLSYRTLNELSSVQFNIVSNFSEAIESPFVGWQTIKNIGSIGQTFSGEEVKYGTYRGMTERGRYLTKMVPGMKQYFDLSNMNETYDKYKFYNQSNFTLTPTNLLWMNTVDKKD